MTSEGPSRTSRGAALIRAAHRLLDDEPWILDDPFARGLAGLEDEAHLRAVIKAQALPEFVRMRAFFAIRSRWAEDELRRALRRGVAQYVILGAGAPGSEIVFEFTVSDEALDAADRRLAADYAERAAGYGEPWRSRFHPGALRLELGRLGFSGVHVLSIEEATDRYLRGRRDELTLPSPWRLVRAKI